ncbi:unnamed protein product [Effrenium voratum]|uniref:Uncharacterized protein n=1 Tax=Effrenium voratum TaxID=2562239 RepID=A0AA36HJL5_9DINO|nr:unnamed protein product [Effrenium voratum]
MQTLLSEEVNLDAEAVLLKQAEHWHQLYLDLEATCAKAKREQAMLQQQLNEALDRERHWAAKNLELRSHDAREEALHKARLAEQLANSRLLCQNKEESLCMLRCQVEAKDEELDKVRREQRQGMELCKRLEKTLAQMAEKERLADQKDAELSKTKTELQKEKDICARALQEVREQSKAEASLRQQLGDLKDQQRGLARENEQLRRPLEEEVAKRAALAQQLTSTGLLLKGKEEENAALRSQLVAKEEEVETLRRASRRASLSEQQTEAERAELARKLAEVAQRAATKDQLCEQKDSELGKLRTELKTERSLCQSAMQEAGSREVGLNGTATDSADRCWNCCETPKCEGVQSTAANYAPVVFKNCVVKVGKWEVKGTVVKPQMLQTTIRMKLNVPADYMCREKCAVLDDNGAIRPPTLFSQQWVYRAGGVTEDVKCAFGTTYVDGEMAS